MRFTSLIILIDMHIIEIFNLILLIITYNFDSNLYIQSSSAKLRKYKFIDFTGTKTQKIKVIY